MDMNKHLQAALGCAAWALAAASHAAPTYQLTDVGNLGSGYAAATGLNTAGELVGTANPGGPLTVYNGFRTGTGQAQAMKPLIAGGYTRAYAINDHGWVVGDSRSIDGWGRAVLWKKGKPLDLGKLPAMWNSIATAVNSRGDVVGYSDHGARYSYGVLWSQGQMRMIGPGQTTVTGINDAGEIIGNQRPYPSNGVLNCWRMAADGTLSYLPKLAGNICAAAAINQAGDIAGSSLVATGGTHAVLYRAGVPTDLGGLGGTAAGAAGLNDSGGIVGYAYLPDGRAHAALFALGADPIDLNTLLDPVSGAGYELTAARSINAAGQIAATATKDGTTRAVLLTPMP